MNTASRSHQSWAVCVASHRRTPGLSTGPQHEEAGLGAPIDRPLRAPRVESAMHHCRIRWRCKFAIELNGRLRMAVYCAERPWQTQQKVRFLGRTKIIRISKVIQLAICAKG